MGEIAEMMLDGTLCEGCGVYLGSGNGYATYCAGCERERRQQERPAVARVNCDICGKRVKAVGLEAHKRAVHAKRLGL